MHDDQAAHQWEFIACQLLQAKDPHVDGQYSAQAMSRQLPTGTIFLSTAPLGRPQHGQRGRDRAGLRVGRAKTGRSPPRLVKSLIDGAFGFLRAMHSICWQLCAPC